MIRQKIKMRCGEIGMKPSTLATKIGCNQSAFSSFICGRRGINIKYIEKAMEVLDLTLVTKENFHFERPQKVEEPQK